LSAHRRSKQQVSKWVWVGLKGVSKQPSKLTQLNAGGVQGHAVACCNLRAIMLGIGDFDNLDLEVVVSVGRVQLVLVVCDPAAR
jgi:hypothetical protein